VATEIETPRRSGCSSDILGEGAVGVKLRDMDAKSIALTILGKTLKSRGYRFVAVTPETHCCALDRPPPGTTVESIFGWNRPFDRESVDSEIFYLLEDAEALERELGRYRSKVRFATIDDFIFAHSAASWRTGCPFRKLYPRVAMVKSA
jgi:hypothetical protein